MSTMDKSGELAATHDRGCANSLLPGDVVYSIFFLTSGLNLWAYYSEVQPGPKTQTGEKGAGAAPYGTDDYSYSPMKAKPRLPSRMKE